MGSKTTRPKVQAALSTTTPALNCGKLPELPPFTQLWTRPLVPSGREFWKILLYLSESFLPKRMIRFTKKWVSCGKDTAISFSMARITLQIIAHEKCWIHKYVFIWSSWTGHCTSFGWFTSVQGGSRKGLRSGNGDSRGELEQINDHLGYCWSGNKSCKGEDYVVAEWYDGWLKESVWMPVIVHACGNVWVSLTFACCLISALCLAHWLLTGSVNRRNYT